MHEEDLRDRGFADLDSQVTSYVLTESTEAALPVMPRVENCLDERELRVAVAFALAGVVLGWAGAIAALNPLATQTGKDNVQRQSDAWRILKDRRIVARDFIPPDIFELHPNDLERQMERVEARRKKR